MTDIKYKKFIENAPYGFAYHKIVLDENRKAVDYIFLDVNREFEKLTGLKKEEIIHKKVSNILPEINENFDWIKYYGEVVLEGKRKVFEQYSKPLDKHYRVIVEPQNGNFFTTFFVDITPEIFTRDMARTFLLQSTDDIDYKKITDVLCEISGAKYVVFNKLRDEKNDFTTVAISGANKDIQKAADILGFKLIGKIWDYDPAREKIIEEDIITHLNSLNNLTGSIISPPGIVSHIEKSFNIGEVIIVKITKDDLILGDFTLLMPQNSDLKNKIMVEMYAQQVGLLLEKNRVRNEIAETKKRLELAMDAADHGFWDYNYITDEIYYSPGYFTMLGYNPGELPMKKETWEKLMHPDDRIKVIPKVNQYIKKGVKYKIEFRLKCKDGSWKWISGRGKSYEREENGSPTRAVGVHVDIDKYVRAREEIKREKNILQTVLDGIPDIIMLLKPDHTIISYNKTGYEMLGKSYQEVDGKKCYSVIGHEKSCENCFSFKALESKEPVIVEKYISYLEKWYEAISIPILDSEGNVELIINKLHDITQRKIAEEKLKTGEENFRTFFETTDDIITVVNKKGIILYANKAVVEKLGYTKNEMINKNILEFYQDKYTDKVLQVMLDLISKKDKICRFPLTKKDGTLLPVETKVWHGKWNGKEITFGLSKDLSKEQEALQKFNKLFNNNPALMTVSHYDSRKIVNVNNAFLNTLGYRREEVIGRTTREIQLFIENENLDKAIEELKQTGHINNAELMLRTKDNKIINGILSGEIIKSQGKKYLLTVTIDITARKIAESELRYYLNMQDILMRISSKYINLSLNEVDNAINRALKDLGEFVSADRSYIFYYDFENNMTSNIYEWCSDGIIPQKENLQNVSLDNIPDWVNTHKKGKAMDIPNVSELEPGPLKSILEMQRIKSLITIPLMLRDKCIGFVGFDSVRYHYEYSATEKNLLSIFAQIVVNIKGRRELENKLIKEKNTEEKANKAKSEFLANMSHEIRTPLNAIIGFTDLLLDTEMKMEQKEYMENINISSRSLLNIINDILDLSKIEADMLRLDEIKVDIIQLIDNTADIVKYNAAKKNIELILDIDYDIPKYIKVDPVRLKQILVNLLTNAVKFTDRGEVILSLRYREISEKKGAYTFKVKDTGIGISPENQKKLFKVFSQADSSTTRKFGGTGLGLVISNMIAEKMGSRIELSSAEGKGSEFYFTIEKECEYRNDDIKTDYLQKDYKTVLIVDDNKTNLKILRRIFDSWDIKSRTFESGEKALNIDFFDFDIIIVDYNMPGLNGIETIKKIYKKIKAKTEIIPIFILYFFNYDKDIEEIKGIDYYKLKKPVKRHELYNLLNQRNKIINIKKEDNINQKKYSAKKEKKLKNMDSSYKHSIMIAEDVDANVMLMRKLIEKKFNNVFVIEASNGNDAIEKYIKYKPDVILMDIQMPNVDGYQATKKIRAVEFNENMDKDNNLQKSVSIIALTARVLKGEKERCIKAGMDDYISKPVDQNELIILLKRYLNNTENKKTEFNIHVDIDLFKQRTGADTDLFYELMDTVKVNMSELLTNMNEAIKEKDYKRIDKILHSIKGLSLNMSFPQLSHIAKQIDKDGSYSYYRDLFKKMETEWSLIQQDIYQ